MPRPSASIHEPTWAGVAPTAPAAWNTITAELANPTSTVTKPAATADTDRSRARDTRPLYTPRVRAYLLSRLGQTVLVVFLSLSAVFRSEAGSHRRHGQVAGQRHPATIYSPRARLPAVAARADRPGRVPLAERRLPI